jgi:2,4-dienoyl-CoA reductase-like NADH-dependent reductase (Old Yellow Enzyme family)
MTEGLADPSTNAPNMAHVRLYEAWGKVGAGLLVTGNVMVDRAYLEAPGNVAIENDDHLPLLQQWAAASQAGGSVTIVQLSHPGGYGVHNIPLQFL